VVVCAAIDIHKHVFQAGVFYSESGEVVEERLSADRQSLGRRAEQWRGRVEAVAIEATTGWRRPRSLLRGRLCQSWTRLRRDHVRRCPWPRSGRRRLADAQVTVARREKRRAPDWRRRTDHLLT
jgi:hypothetical protein